MFDTHPKIGLYLYPFLFILVGTLMLTRDDWFWGGVFVYILAVLAAITFSIMSVLREQSGYIREKSDFYETMIKFYNRIESLSQEEKYILGLTYAPNEVQVKVDKTSVAENEFSQLWRKLPVAPYKLKVIAQAAINGERFTFRKWAGKGKLLTPSEWESLREKMFELGMVEQAHDYAAQQGFNWTGLGIDVMEQAVKDSIVVGRTES